MRHGTGQSGDIPGFRSFIAVVALLLVMMEASAADSVELVKDINPGSSSGGAGRLTDVNGTLFFSARVNTGNELWKSDGTADGTVQVLEICGGLQSGIPAAAEFINLNGTLYFAATDCNNGVELWRSDGTPEGTVMAADIDPDNPDGSGSPADLTAVGNELFFSADDGVNGRELWKYDPVTEVATMVADIHPGSSSNPSGLTNVNGTLFFAATTGGTSIGGTGNELWKHDPATNTTALVKDIHPNGTSNSSNPHNLTNVGGVLYFAASHESDLGINNELWKSDGTEPGTVRVKDILPGNASSSPNHLTDVNGTLFFAARNTLNNLELWKSDGTEAGTVQVHDIFPGDGGSGPNHLTNVNGTLFFVATYEDGDGSIDRELWKSDGTADGTVLVKDIIANVSSDPEELFNFNGTLYFAATRSTFLGLEGTELWKSDGTADGTVLVADIHPTGNSIPAGFAVSNHVLFFVASDDTSGRELRKLVPVIDMDEICDNGVDDDGDGQVDDDDPDCSEPLVRCFHTPIYSPNENEIFTIHASAIDRAGGEIVVDSLEIWLGSDQSAPQATAVDSQNLSLEYPAAGAFSYGCRAINGGNAHFSGMRSVAVGEFDFPAIPVLINGPLARKIDVIFYADRDEYSSFTDPDYIRNVGLLVSQGYWTNPWFVEFQDYFNFWIGKANDANSGPDPDSDETDPRLVLCLREPPSDFLIRYLFADVAAIVHESACRDNAGSSSFTMEMELNRLQVIAHESGHRPFGLADEYCCNASYYSNPPSANLLNGEIDCILQAGARGFDPSNCRILDSSTNDTQGWIFEPDYTAFLPEVPDLMQQTGCTTLRSSDPRCAVRIFPDITGPDDNPNGLYACDDALLTYAGDTDGVFDSSDFYWLCRTPGDAASAVWQRVGSRFDSYDVGASELDRLSWFLSNCDGGSC